MSLSLSPNSLYRQTTDCTEGGGLTREHCITEILLKVAFNTVKQTNKNQNLQIYDKCQVWFLHLAGDCHGHRRDRMVVGFTTLPMQPVVSLNPSHGELYSIQH